MRRSENSYISLGEDEYWDEVRRFKSMKLMARELAIAAVAIGGVWYLLEPHSSILNSMGLGALLLAALGLAGFGFVTLNEAISWSRRLEEFADSIDAQYTRMQGTKSLVWNRSPEARERFSEL